MNPALKEGDSYYESKAAVDLLSRWYCEAKETSFAKIIVSDFDLANDKAVLEIGGGAGIQGVVYQKILGQSYVHSDISPALVAQASLYGLRSTVVDALDMPFEDGSIGGVIAIGPSTITRGEETRYRQFIEIHRVLAPKGKVVFVTSRLASTVNLHCLDKKDLAELERIGLRVEKIGNWGIIPKVFWKGPFVPICRFIEHLAHKLSIGVRKYVICRKL